MKKWLKRLAKWGAIVVAIAFIAFLVAYWRSDNDCEHLQVGAGSGMKALVHCDYGAPDVLKVIEIAKPAPGEHEMLIRVHAASVNPLDWHFVRGTPYAMRFGSGLRKPKDMQVGVDFAGVVEAVGPGVTRFKAGDQVFGGRHGAIAEFVVARDDRAVVPMPAGITFEQAASLPIAAVTALQGLRDKGKLQPGQKVLINGASGGVGTFAVQIAKAMGAEVTGVCSTRNLDLVRSLGADHVVDYTKEDYTKGEARYDLVVDNVGNRSLAENRRALAPSGMYVLIGGGGPNDGKWIGPLAKPVAELIEGPFVKQKMVMLLADLSPDDLTALAGQVASGTLKPVIDRRYPLSEAAEAIRYLEAGHARGKVLVTVEPEGTPPPAAGSSGS